MINKKEGKENKLDPGVLLYFVILFLFVFGVSLSRILFWNDYNNKNEKIKKDTIKEVVTKKEEELVVDFGKLKEKNEEVVAYIKVNGTDIEYPVVKHNDNNYYLNHNIDKEYNDAGWVFANYENRFDGTDKNITLFAHNRLDGSMFGTLKDTLESKWQSNPKNFIITFITEKAKYTYQVFSTYKTKVEDYYIESNFTDEEYSKFLETIKARSNYDYGVSLSITDQVLTLSTCASGNKDRIVLHAKRN